MRIHLNIGSNQGDRMALTGRAVGALARLLSPCRMYLSPYVESEPWGFESVHRFLNRGVLIITPDTRMPEEILDVTQQVESLVGDGRSHRNPDGSYRDRSLDIDIIDIDGMRLDTPRLTLPHPRAKERPFVEGPRQWLDSHYPDVSL